MKSIYFKDKLCIINFSKRYFENYEALLNSEEFRLFLTNFLIALKENQPKLSAYLFKLSDKPIDYLIKTAKLLSVFELKEFNDLAKESNFLLEIVEESYNYWRKLTRYSIIYTNDNDGLLNNNFMEADQKFNDLIISFYRLLEEKLQEHKNSVYRQLQAGSNGSILMVNHQHQLPVEYQVLNNIPFIYKVMLRTPLILHTKHNKRRGLFTETFNNPIKDFKGGEDFFCIPIMVGETLTFMYFHSDFINGAVGLTNLFQLAPLEAFNRKPDCIILFGVNDGKEDTTFYYDEKNDIYLGKLSYQPIIEYFGYFKKMALTLHNLTMIKKHALPIHGAMINLYFKNGLKKGVVLMGDSGAGKSESIEALEKIANDKIIKKEIIFDDMGFFFLKDGRVMSCGTEIGAFIRLDDLDKGSIYKDLDRSVFFNPESNKNARLIVPETAYQVVIDNHEVDAFLYANNYDRQIGIRRVDIDEFKAICKEGKRYALGTTGEVGISKTYFANPFGPVQKEAECNLIIDEIFDVLARQDTFVGEIFTGLGLSDKGGNTLEIGAKKMLELFGEDDE